MTIEECIDKRSKVNVSCYNVCGIPFNVSGYLLEPKNYFGSQYYLHVGMPDKYLVTPLLLKKLDNYWFDNTEERDVFVKSIYDEKGHCLYSDHYMDEDSIAYHMNKYSCYSELINKKFTYNTDVIFRCCFRQISCYICLLYLACINRFGCFFSRCYVPCILNRRYRYSRFDSRLYLLALTCF